MTDDNEPTMIGTNQNGALLSRGQMLQSRELPWEDVHVTAWGGTVRVYGLTGAERDALEQSMVEQKGRRRTFNANNFRAKLLVQAIRDESGARIFSDGDAAALAAQPAAALQPVFEVAMRLSRLSDEDVEELEKN